MGISFNCESCKKKIKAPDTAGGKYGKCPNCNHRCYIPLPKADDEPELVLAPIDESAESQMADLMKETRSLTHHILQQNQPIDDEPGQGASGGRTAEEKEIIKHCILYLRQMADSDLKPADKTFKLLKKNKKPTLRVLASMARAERPEPELSDLPDAILQSLIHDAERKLS
jgi:hypothetical protein